MDLKNLLLQWRAGYESDRLNALEKRSEANAPSPASACGGFCWVEIRYFCDFPKNIPGHQARYVTIATSQLQSFKRGSLRNSLIIWSGRRDSNSRPLAPHASVLPS